MWGSTMKIIVIAGQPEGAVFAVEVKYDLELIMILLSQTWCSAAPATQRYLRQPTQARQNSLKLRFLVKRQWKDKHIDPTWLVDFAHPDAWIEPIQRNTECGFTVLKKQGLPVSCCASWIPSVLHFLLPLALLLLWSFAAAAAWCYCLLLDGKPMNVRPDQPTCSQTSIFCPFHCLHTPIDFLHERLFIFIIL